MHNTEKRVEDIQNTIIIPISVLNWITKAMKGVEAILEDIRTEDFPNYE